MYMRMNDRRPALDTILDGLIAFLRRRYMRQYLFAVVLLLAAGNSALAGGSWIFQPSTYSHNLQTGDRVAQYAAKPPVYGPSDPTYKQIAYIHKRTAMRGVGGSVERHHYVETWGTGCSTPRESLTASRRAE